MSNNNYPDGAVNDPTAPYNQKEPKMSEFEETSIGECEKCSKQGPLDDDWVCESCFEPEELYEDDGSDQNEYYKDEELKNIVELEDDPNEP